LPTLRVFRHCERSEAIHDAAMKEKSGLLRRKSSSQ
jgi:hypothetical protein